MSTTTLTTHWYPLAHPGAIKHIGSNTGLVIAIRYPAGGYQESMTIAGVGTTVERGAAHYSHDLQTGTSQFVRKEPDRLATYVHGRSLRDSRLTVAHIGDERAVPGATYRITGGTPPGAAKIREAARIGGQHGKAGASWHIERTCAGEASNRHLLAAITGGDPGVLARYQIPGLTQQSGYTRDDLAADLGLGSGHGLVPDEQILTRAADAYLAAARYEFRLEAGRLAGRNLDPGDRAPQAGPEQERSRQ